MPTTEEEAKEHIYYFSFCGLSGYVANTDAIHNAIRCFPINFDTFTKD